MLKKPLYVHLLLDRSGSMEANRDITIDAFNEYVNGLRLSDEVSARLSLTLFDSEGIDLVHDSLPVAEFPNLTRESFVPRASTPLLDAIGRTINHIDAVKLRGAEKVAFAIVTDGLENASKEFTVKTVREALKRRQDENDWQVLFLGAGIDAIKEADKIGVAKMFAMNYSHGKSKETFEAARNVQTRHAHRASASAPKEGFTEKERKDAE
jgi:hypothetical protein